MTAPLQSATKRTSFKLAKRWEPLHTGGHVALTADGRLLCTTLGDAVIVTSLDDDQRVGTLAGDSSSVSCLACTPSTTHPTLLVGYRSQALALFDLATSPPLPLQKTAHAHDAPVVTCTADPSASVFATGDTAGVVKVWDARRGHCTHVFRGHGGIVSALAFDVDQSAQAGKGRARLAVGSSDGRVRIWDLIRRTMVGLLEGHSSAVRGIGFSHDGATMISGGRDKVVNLWDTSVKGQGRLRKSVPVFESLEALVVVGSTEAEAPPGETPLRFLTAGETGVVKLWNEGGECLARRDTGAAVYDARLASPRTLVVTQTDHNILLCDAPSLDVARQLVGFNDEIVEACLLHTPPADRARLLAVANNSAVPRLYDLRDHLRSFLLRGHAEIVLALSASFDGVFLATGSRDQTVRIWQADPATGSWGCAAVCRGHVGAVGAIAFARRANRFLASVSQDRTLKLWDLTPLEKGRGGQEASLQSLVTLKVHDKDVNAVDVAPHDRLIATASQDRTAKIFEVSVHDHGLGAAAQAASVRHVGTLVGHSRGVWSVRFSTHDQCVATSSADRTIKLWSLKDFACLKTFEGHTNSVLRVGFLSAGTQLASTASDGLVKVWDVKTEQCVVTLDGHNDKVWAIAIGGDGDSFVTGGADSHLVEWVDATKEDAAEIAGQREEQVAQSQDLESYIALEDYKNAIVLTLLTGNNARLLSLFRRVAACRPASASGAASEDATSATGLAAVDAVVASLRGEHLKRLLQCVNDWNSVSSTAGTAQDVAYAILRQHPLPRLLDALAPEPSDGPAKVAGGPVGADTLVPFTERHLSRAQRCLQEAASLRYLLDQMQ